MVSLKTALEMRAMMAEVVKSGTGKEAAVPGYPVAGKTGTARKPQNIKGNPDGYRGRAGPLSLRIDVRRVRAGRQARFSIIVVIDEPTTSIFASDVAAPLFSGLASYALRLFHVPPPSLVDSLAPLVPTVSPDARTSDATTSSAAPVGPSH